MNILHVHEIAGVAGILAKYQRKAGHNVTNIIKESLDTLGFSDVYNEDLIRCDNHKFRDMVISYTKQYDVIHIHGQMVGYFARKLKMVYPDKKLVAHYYGYNDTAAHTSEIDKAVDLALCIRGLENIHPSFIPLDLPVNIERLSYRKHSGYKALYFSNKYVTYEGNKPYRDLTDEAMFAAEIFGLDLNVVDRRKNPIPFKDLPEYIHNYDVFLEYRGDWLHKQGVVLGMAALEALYSGLRVFHLEQGVWFDRFPYSQRAEFVVDMLDNIYRSELKIK